MNLTNFLNGIADAIRYVEDSTDEIPVAYFIGRIKNIKDKNSTVTATEINSSTRVSDICYGIAEAIRYVDGTSSTINACDFDERIKALKTSGGTSEDTPGITPQGTISIDENGDYDVTNYAGASVNVPVGIFPTGQRNIVSNGTYDVSIYANANVNVPVGVFPEGNKDITTNGTYNVREFENAVVNVPVGVFPSGQKEITANGIYDITNFASAFVNIASGVVFPSNVSVVTKTIASDTNGVITIPHGLGETPNTVLFFYVGTRKNYSIYSGMMRTNNYNVYVNNAFTYKAIGSVSCDATNVTLSTTSTSYYFRAGTYYCVCVKN